MATIQVFNPEDGLQYSVTATIETSVVAGSNAGENRYFIKLNTNKKDPSGAGIYDQIIENIVSDVTTAVQDSLFVIIEHAEGAFLSSESSFSLYPSSSKSSSSQSESTQSKSSISTSSQ